MPVNQNPVTPVPEPTEFPLWQDIQGKVRWPEPNEAIIFELGDAWYDNSERLTAAAQRYPGAVQGLEQDWDDTAGHGFVAQAHQVVQRIDETATKMADLAVSVAAFSTLVSTLKTGIRNVIEMNTEKYARFETLPLGAGEEAKAQFATSIAGLIQKMIDAAVAQAGGRTSPWTPILSDAANRNEVLENLEAETADNIVKDLQEKYLLTGAEAATEARKAYDARTKEQREEARRKLDELYRQADEIPVDDAARRGEWAEDLRRWGDQQRAADARLDPSSRVGKVGRALGPAGFVYDLISGKPLEQAGVSWAAGAAGGAIGALGGPVGTVAGGLIGSGLADAWWENYGPGSDPTSEDNSAIREATG